MEKPMVKSKMKLLKFLPKAVSAIRFQNLPSSPGMDKIMPDNAHKLKTHTGKGFSDPINSITLVESRRKSKNSNFQAQEPTSPKVSCMGQVKHNKNICKQNHLSIAEGFKSFSTRPQVKKKPLTKNILRSGKPVIGRISDASADPKLDRAPTLSQKRRFASGRDTFTNFDWTVEIAPADSDPLSYIYYSDEERGESNCGVALEPKKEINLWKRRTMAQPKPLRLNTMVAKNC